MRNTNVYIDVLEDIVHNYNHTFHQSIQVPGRKFLMDPKSGAVLTNHFKFPNDIQVGDYVRILKEKKQFQKGYADNFSTQIYHVIQGNGYTFSLQDENEHRLVGNTNIMNYAKSQKLKSILIEKLIEKNH